MNEREEKDYRALAEFWNNAFSYTDTEIEEDLKGFDPETDIKAMAPSEKLYQAAGELGTCRRVLDYGCGTGWAALTVAAAGCGEVIAADVSDNATRIVAHYAKAAGLGTLHTVTIDADWLSQEAAESYDGLICSNVLDVVPKSMSDAIIREAARVLKPGARAVIGLNFYMKPEDAVARGMDVRNGDQIFTDDVLRLVLADDEAWAARFSKYFDVESTDHFAWPGEKSETRRLFRLRRR